MNCPVICIKINFDFDVLKIFSKQFRIGAVNLHAQNTRLKSYLSLINQTKDSENLYAVQEKEIGVDQTIFKTESV